MNVKVKLAAYAVLVILAIWFGWGFYAYYSAVTWAATENAADGAAAVSTPDATTPPATNVVTNAVEDVTNLAGGLTNATPIAAESSNTPATPPAVPVKKKTKHPPVQLRTPEEARGRMIRYLGALIATLVALGILVALDFTNLLGSQATKYLFQDVANAMRDPVYERAEAEWANGHFLEAVQLLREYLKDNPREIHAALRIAEIYEKDLKNMLAAALEYEEVLKHKLEPERWGWAAIHLCNLYSKLGQQPKAMTLLRRIVDDYPRTAAARKARTRLGIEELVEEAAGEQGETEEAPLFIETPPPATPPPSPEPPEEPPKSNLPPGFSRK
jgi:hypothetical protein